MWLLFWFFSYSSTASLIVCRMPSSARRSALFTRRSASTYSSYIVFFSLSTIHTCNLLVFISSWCNAITSGINSAVIGLFLFMIVFNSLTSCPSLLCNGFKGFTSSRSWAVALCTTCYMFRSHCHCFNCSFNVQISSSLLVSIPVANEHVDCIDTILHCHFFKCIAFVRFSPTEQNIVFMQF